MAVQMNIEFLASPDLAFRYVHISSKDITDAGGRSCLIPLIWRTDAGRSAPGDLSSRSMSSILMRWRPFFDPGGDGDGLYVHHPGYGGYGTALRVHVHRRVYGPRGVVAAIAVRGEAIGAVAASVGLLASGQSGLREPVGAAVWASDVVSVGALSCHRSAFTSLELAQIITTCACREYSQPLSRGNEFDPSSLANYP